MTLEDLRSSTVSLVKELADHETLLLAIFIDELKMQKSIMATITPPLCRQSQNES